MDNLLVVKERIKKFVGKNDVFILPALKFLLTFLVLLRINSTIGFMSLLKNGAVTLIIALAGSFLPLNLTLVILSLIVVGHLYSLSFECAVFVLAMFVIMFLLYFRFAAKDSAAVLLVPLAFGFKVPYVMPVAMGLVGTVTSMVSTACGTIVYFVLHYISVNSSELATSGGVTSAKLGSFKSLVDGILTNKAMIVTVAAFAITVLVVYFIRRLSIKYSWTIAIVTGAVGCFLIILVGNVATHAGISVGGAFLGMIISIILNVVLQYFCFDLDYNRVEKVQFEDDEYYYYVKAVPKNTVKLSDNGKKKAVTEKPRNVNVKREPVERSETQVRARETVRATATQAAKTRTQNKGPLGLSGGRPAGEGRKKD